MTPTTTGPLPATQGTVRRGDLAAVWTSASAAVVAEVDLDVEHPAPPPRRRPLVAGAVVAAVVGLVAASALRSAVTDPPAPTAPAVTAWAQVRSVGTTGGTTGGTDGGTDGGTADGAVVVLLTVANRGTTDRLVTTVDVAGVRSAGPAATLPPRRGTGPGAEQDRALPGTVLQPLPLSVPAGSTAVAALRLPVRCDGPAGTGGTGPGLDLRVRLADATAPVAVVPVGALAGADGACAAVRAARPAGTDAPVTVGSATFTATSARLLVEGLPTTARVVAVTADGVPVPLTETGGTSGGTSGVTLVLAAPAPGCTAGARDVVPTGLELEVDADGTRSTRYAAVGPALARWLLTTRCPAAQEVRG